MKIKRLSSMLLIFGLLLNVCFGTLACSFPLPYLPERIQQKTWYLFGVKYDQYRGRVLTTGIDLFADKDYPLTYDCLQLKFLENDEVEIYGVHLGTKTGKVTMCYQRDPSSKVLDCVFKLKIDDRTYKCSYSEVWEGVYSTLDIWENDINFSDFLSFTCSPKGLSYAEYLNSVEFGKTHTPSGRWYTKGATIYDTSTGEKKFIGVSQEVEYKGAPLTEERYIVDFDAENQSLVLSILDIQTNTYIEKNGTFGAYIKTEANDDSLGNWVCEGTFEDGTKFTAERTIKEDKEPQFFCLTYQGETIYWEYEIFEN